MRVTLETNRSLFYATCKWVDLRNKLEEQVNRLKEQEKPFSDEMNRMKHASKVCDLLTHWKKYVKN